MGLDNVQQKRMRPLDELRFQGQRAEQSLRAGQRAPKLENGWVVSLCPTCWAGLLRKTLPWQRDFIESFRPSFVEDTEIRDTVLFGVVLRCCGLQEVYTHKRMSGQRLDELLSRIADRPEESNAML